MFGNSSKLTLSAWYEFAAWVARTSPTIVATAAVVFAARSHVFAALFSSKPSRFAYFAMNFDLPMR